jgi:hypothetical protein
MTTLVTCTVPGGLNNLPLGASLNSSNPFNTGVYALINAVPPSVFDVQQGVLTNNGNMGPSGTAAFTFSVDAGAWAAFVNSSVGQTLTKSQSPGMPPALIAAN